MKKRLSVSLAVAATALVACAGFSWGEPLMGKGMNHEKRDCQSHVDRMARILDLTATQKEQIKGLCKAEQEATAPLRQKQHDLHRQLRQVEDQASFDEAAVRAIAESISRNQVEMIVSRAKVRSEISALLTPAQRSLAHKLEPELGQESMPPQM